LGRRIELKILLILMVLSALVPFALAHAGNNVNHKVAVHVMPHASRSCSKGFPAIDDCDDIVYEYEGCGDIDVFPVFFGLTEVTAVQYSLTWPAAWGTCLFTACAGDLTMGGISDSGDWTSHAWTECQHVSVVVPGFGWLAVSGPGLVCPHLNLLYRTLTTDCSFREDVPYESYCAGICGEEGENPCGYPTAADESTWGSIKAMFR
jgi:hypothetical protein